MRYPGLWIVAIIHRVLGLVVVASGFVVTFLVASGLVFLPVVGGGAATVTILIVGVMGSLIAGLFVYAAGDFCQCFLDIEKNTRTD